MRPFPALAAFLALLVGAFPAAAADVRAAVAANFAEPAAEIAAAFTAATGHRVRRSTGASGLLFAQISQGAPFDVFLAADQVRPQRAVEAGLAVAGSRFTYARGRLALFSRDPGRVTGPETLATGGFSRLAIANPETAPYGAAALDTLDALDLLPAVAPRLVRGANVAQAFQFVATGNAELGFVALSQIRGDTGGSAWIIPADLHDPIDQDAVLLTSAADNAAARAFLDFLKGAETARILEFYGYATGERG